MEIATGLFSFLAEPLVNLTIALNSLWPYYYAVMACTGGLILGLFLIVTLAYKSGPECFRNLDQPREQFFEIKKSTLLPPSE